MLTSDSEGDDHSCELGKLSHWEQVYRQELLNLETTGDEGEIWCLVVPPSRFGAVVAVLMRSLRYAGLAKMSCTPWSTGWTYF